MASQRVMLFRGQHPALVSGNAYTYKELASVAKVGVNTMKNRVCHLREVTDEHLYPVNGRCRLKNKRPVNYTPLDRLVTKIDKESQQWLRRSLL